MLPDHKPESGRSHSNRVSKEKPKPRRSFKELATERRRFLKVMWAFAVALGLTPVVMWIENQLQTNEEVPFVPPNQLTEISNENQVFAHKLLDLIEVTPQTTKAELMRIAHERTFADKNATWMHNQVVGSYKNVYDEEIQLSLTDEGEPEINKPISDYIEYKDPPSLEVHEIKSGDALVYIYGSSETIARLRPHEEAFKAFVSDYFQDITATEKILHLNFAPLNYPDVPLRGKQPPGWRWGNAEKKVYGLGNVVISPEGAILSAQTLLNMNNITYGQEHFGLTYEDTLTSLLVNEKVTIVAAQHDPLNSRKRPNESWSTLAGFASIFDASGVTRRLLLGDNDHGEFFEVLGNEMRLLRSKGNRIPPHPSSHTIYQNTGRL